MIVSLLFLALLTGCPKNPAVTRIVSLTADPVSIDRGDSVTITWEAVDPGTLAGAPSCSITRRFENEEPDDHRVVACAGSLIDTPLAPSTSTYVRYQLAVVKRPINHDDPYLTALVTVTLAEVTPEPAILTVAIDQPSLTLDAGAVTTLTATVTTQGSPDTTIHWSSSDTATATITLMEGQLTAHAAGTTTITATSAHDPSKQAAITVTVEDRTPGDLLWRRIMGASMAGAPGGVAVDAAGNVVLGFSTPGNYWGPSAGDFDVVLGKFDASGTSLWFRQFGTPAPDYVEDVAVDADGNVVATGYTTGNLGGTNPGETSVFVVKYAPDGSLLWSRLFGTEASDRGRAIATDSEGNVFVGGVTAGDLGGPRLNLYDDGFLAKLGPDGDVLWIRQFGDYLTEWVDGIAVGPNDGAAVVSTGYRNSGKVRRFDADGNPLWVQSLGNYRGMAGVAFDAAGHVLATGYGTDAPGHIPDTAFLSRYDDDGVLTWTRWVGPAEGSFARAVAADAFGSAFVLGVTSGDFGGVDPPAPAFLAKYDALGSRLWVRQFHPDGRDLAIDASGNAFVTGADGGDIVLMKLSR